MILFIIFKFIRKRMPSFPIKLHEVVRKSSSRGRRRDCSDMTVVRTSGPLLGYFDRRNPAGEAQCRGCRR